MLQFELVDVSGNDIRKVNLKVKFFESFMKHNRTIFLSRKSFLLDARFKWITVAIGDHYVKRLVISYKENYELSFVHWDEIFQRFHVMKGEMEQFLSFVDTYVYMVQHKGFPVAFFLDKFEQKEFYLYEYTIRYGR